jgi:hypothetical protein
MKISIRLDFYCQIKRKLIGIMIGDIMIGFRPLRLQQFTSLKDVDNSIDHKLME